MVFDFPDTKKAKTMGCLLMLWKEWEQKVSALNNYLLEGPGSIFRKGKEDPLGERVCLGQSGSGTGGVRLL